MSDVLYDYSTFSDERITEIFTGWDGLGGYHGLLVKKCAGLFYANTALDVGCGLCHLYEALLRLTHRRPRRYVGIEKHPLILTMARERYPDLEIVEGDLYDLPDVGRFDTTYAVGLYREEPKTRFGIEELWKHTNRCLILTYFASERGAVPESLVMEGFSCEFIEHVIDDRLEIVRMWRHRL